MLDFDDFRQSFLIQRTGKKKKKQQPHKNTHPHTQKDFVFGPLLSPTKALVIPPNAAKDTTFN